MTQSAAPYDEDFVLWSKAQAEALRAAARGATNQPIDWENVAEEIESLGRSDKRELASQIRRVIEHLLKLEYSSATDPRRGWIESIGNARNDIEAVLDDSPSLNSEVRSFITTETRRAARKVVRDLEGYGELDRALHGLIPARVYTREEVLGDWFPPDPDKAGMADRG